MGRLSRPNIGENAYRMTGFGQNSGFCDIITIANDSFLFCAFGAIPYLAHPFEGFSFGLYHITVVDMNHRFFREISLDHTQIVISRGFRYLCAKIAREALDGIDFFGILLECLRDIRYETAFRCQCTIAHISSKFGKGAFHTRGNLCSKIQN